GIAIEDLARSDWLVSDPVPPHDQICIESGSGEDQLELCCASTDDPKILREIYHMRQQTRLAVVRALCDRVRQYYNVMVPDTRMEIDSTGAKIFAWGLCSVARAAVVSGLSRGLERFDKEGGVRINTGGSAEVTQKLVESVSAPDDEDFGLE
ncbi:hypothetical protein BaRGS_00002689, partial [Batillaria attramentaria]